MSGKVLFACSKCFSRHPFEELSAGQNLCKTCRGSSSVVKCTHCRSEFQAATKSQAVCKKCDHNFSKYGKPSACECCKIVAAFGCTKCMRCASYESKYGPPVQCDECKQRSAFDKRDENKKINGKLLCWLCTCAFKRAVMKAQHEGRIQGSSKKRPHEKSHRDQSSMSSKKSSRSAGASDLAKGQSGNNAGTTNSNTSATTATVSSSTSGLDLPEKILRGIGGNGLGSIVAPAVVSIDPNSADHVVAMTNLKERIASLEKRLQQKDKELLEKDKLLTVLKGSNFEKENEMRNKMKEVDRLHDMKVENLNRKVTSLLKELAGLKRVNKQMRGRGGKRDNVSPKDDLKIEDSQDSKDVAERDRGDDERDEKAITTSSSSSSNSPSIN